MKTPLDWLAEYVDIKGLTPEKISDGLRMSGTENVLEKGLSLPNVVVGEIKEITKHPNADKLQITKTDVGKANGGVLQIVCGAPNIEVGQKVPVALIGAKFEDFEIKKAKIRDVESNGMLCAEDELGLGNDHSGIMILDKTAKVGQLFSEYLGGGAVVIDAELTPNRGDCLSVIGMAREVAATFDRKFKMPVVKKPEVTSKKTIDVEVLDKNLCPRYIAKVVEGVKIGPSPKWMQERLAAAGVRPISNIVDVSNYVMLELGQPLHTFDGKKLNGKIIVRLAKDGEKLVTLDGQERKLTKEDLLICDSKHPVALAGVMGGLNSEVDDKTTTVVIEAAVFDPTSIRKTAQRLNLRSEASNRFEKGIPLSLPEVAIERAAELLMAGSLPAKGKGETLPRVGTNTDVLSSWIWVQHVGLRHSRIQKYLGVDIKEEEVLGILKSLGFEVEKFDFKKEARSHIGKPYVWGAKYKTHGEMAFDCSYLTDLMYSKIGMFIGYVCLGQYELGRPVSDDELQPGDILFVRGLIKHSPTTEYFVPDDKGGYVKRLPKLGKEVGHEAIYIGNGRVIHARQNEYDFKKNKWISAKKQGVVEENVEVFTKNPEYLGARRYVDNPDDYYAITAPWWRGDIKIEEDIIEELARIHGYDKVPATLPSGVLPGGSQNEQIVMESRLKQKLVDQGLTEVITYSFVSEKLAKISGAVLKDMAQISNPLSKDQEYMRSALWPSLLEVIAKNQDFKDELRIFEFANVYGKGGQEEKPHLGIAVRVNNAQKSFFDLKGIIESVLREFSADATSFKSTQPVFAQKGQGAEILVGGKVVGYVGVVEKNIASRFGQKTSVAVADLDLSVLLPNFGKKVIFQPLPKYPRSKRDINIVLDFEVTVQEIERTVANSNAKNLLGYRVVDVYEGRGPASTRSSGLGGLPKDKKSVTINIEIGSDDRTLTEEEISATVDLVIKNLAKIGGELRG